DRVLAAGARPPGPGKRCRVVAHRNVTVDATARELFTFEKRLARMCRAMPCAPADARFVTSDGPVTIARQREAPGPPIPIDLLDPRCGVLAPRWASVALVASWRRPPDGRRLLTINRADREQVALVDQLTIFGATRWVFAAQRDETLDAVVRHAGMQAHDWPVRGETHRGAGEDGPRTPSRRRVPRCGSRGPPWAST